MSCLAARVAAASKMRYRAMQVEGTIDIAFAAISISLKRSMP
jgi:hypothetical protein